LPSPADRAAGLGLFPVKKAGSITNAEYRKPVGVTRKTASRDLDDLVGKGVLDRMLIAAIHACFTGKRFQIVPDNGLARLVQNGYVVNRQIVIDCAGPAIFL